MKASAAPVRAPRIAHDVAAQPGRPLEPAVAAAAGARLGFDFGSVRVHDDGRAAAAAAAIGADAYTVGSSIVLGAGSSRRAGGLQELLEHELVHVAQQARAEAPAGPAVEADDGPAEREARELKPGAPARRPTRLGRRALQRQPTCDLRHPENCPVYEDWIAQFASIGTFTARDTVPDLDPSTGGPRVDPKTRRPLPRPVRTGFQVLGRPVSHEPSAPLAQRRPIAPIGGGLRAQIADRFIDRPTEDWVRHNLPPELQVMAYQLPADCADIAVILRHVWVLAHGRSEEYRGWRVGVVTGTTEAARRTAINWVIGMIVSAYNVNEMVNAYSAPNGRPIRSFAALAPLLHPGDILVWEHRRGSPTGPTRRRTHADHRARRPRRTRRSHAHRMPPRQRANRSRGRRRRS